MTAVLEDRDRDRDHVHMDLTAPQALNGQFYNENTEDRPVL